MSRILHIEDDAGSRLLVRKVLAAAGHEVVDAASGLEGVRLAKQSQPDLVIVDLNIPDLDGYEVALRLRGTDTLAAVPIVAITAEGDRETSLAVGCDGFIEKPIDVRSFPAQIERFLGGHKERPSTPGDPQLRAASQRIVERLEQKVSELSEANERLEELARLRREFLRNLSHELSTPMTPAVGYLKLLLSEELGPLTPMQRKALVAVDAGVSRFRGLIDTLLDVSALETGRLHFFARDYDFAKIAKRAIDEARPRLVDKQITLHVTPSKGALPGYGDPDKVRRAMAHLLDNAIKFTPKGGVVAVRARGDEHALVFEVADSGPGIPADSLPHILEVFYQADGSVTRQFGGVGLGLAFARRVAEAHGGQVAVESPPRASWVEGESLLGALVRLELVPRPSMPAAPPSS
ncbi:MAG: hybrid sensor histidine kinase/response regulator [Sandaracinaceae bacterium]|nr:hybrid sensor histidine kinase/response regulator [Sandaracinaceae bacterium]